MTTEAIARPCFWRRVAPTPKALCVAVMLSLAAMLLTCVYPGDAPWICDEPLLIAGALQANDHGEWISHGLIGSQGTYYGPLPTWIYQIYLSFSTDLTSLVTVRSGAMVLLTGAALWVVARQLRLGLATMFIPLFSPFFWLYSRQLWDNSFCIPLAAIAIGAYLLFVSGRRWAIVPTVLACGAMLLVHLMSVPVIAAIAIHALVVSPRRLWNARWLFLLSASLIVALGHRYWPILATGLSTGGGLRFPGIDALVFTLRGGDWFGGWAFADVLGREWIGGSPLAYRVLLSATGIVHLVVALGMAVSLVRLRRAVWTREEPVDMQTHAAAIALATLAIQWLFYGSRGAIGHVHYYNASWIAYAILIFLALGSLSRCHRLSAVPAATCLALIALLLATITQLHHTHGTRSLRYGPSLTNQLEIARGIAQLPPGTPVIPLVSDIATSPQRILVLLQLPHSSVVPMPSLTSGTAYLVYAKGNPRDGEISLRQEP